MAKQFLDRIFFILLQMAVSLVLYSTAIITQDCCFIDTDTQLPLQYHGVWIVESLQYYGISTLVAHGLADIKKSYILTYDTPMTSSHVTRGHNLKLRAVKPNFAIRIGFPILTE